MTTVAAYEKSIEIGSSALPLSDASLSRSREGIDATDFSQAYIAGFETTKPGLMDWGISGSGFFNKTNAAIIALESGWLAGTSVTAKYLPDGAAGTGGTAFVESLSYSGEMNNLETFELNLQGSGALSAQTAEATPTIEAKHNAYKVTVKKGGTATEMTAEATTLVSGTTYQITATAKRIIDHNTAVVVKDGTTTLEGANITSIDYLQGKVVLAEAPAGAVTIGGKYIPTTDIAGANSYSLTLNQTLKEDTDFATAASGGTRTRRATTRTVELELGRFYDKSADFQAILEAGLPVLVEIGQAGGTLFRRGWFNLIRDDASGAVQDLESEDLSFSLDGNALSSFSLGR